MSGDPNEHHPTDNFFKNNEEMEITDEPERPMPRTDQEEIRNIKDTLQSLMKSVNTLTNSLSSLGEKRKRDISPTPSNSTSNSNSLSQVEISKELIKLVPRYDGSGGIQKFMEFVDNYEDFLSQTDLPTSTELTLATARLTGDAK